MAACVCEKLQIRKLSGYIFHLYLENNCEEVKRSQLTVKLLKLNYGILYDHTHLVQLWSELTVWTT